MARAGALTSFWDEVLRKEERLTQQPLQSWSRKSTKNASAGVEAALGRGWEAEEDAAAGEEAAVAQACRDATVARAIHEACAIRRRAEAEAASLRRSRAEALERQEAMAAVASPAEIWPLTARGDQSWRRTSKRGSWPSSSLERETAAVCQRSLLGPARTARGTSKASKMDAVYLKISPTYAHTDELNWFGSMPTAKTTAAAAKNKLAAAAAATSAIVDKASMAAAGAALEAGRNARADGRCDRMRSSIAGQRLLEEMRGANPFSQRGS
eukprot:TRINITY_DN25523_c0_g1_i1.p1 TRINITY_DN25523_c0_g1~~TRINITY_DN25523_c0_g1_i1.p1  ORF type:complete len:269 (+),score=74.18 TRINITY_DN25523_c0_g1_i1:291-1097(+)